MARLKIKKSSPPEQEAGRPDAGKRVQKSMQVQVTVNCIVSVGDGDRFRSFEEWQSAIFEAVKGAASNADTEARVTPTGGYYLVGGKVCLPQDFDPETKDFKPGGRPPVWARTAADKEQWDILDRIEREKNERPAIARNPPNLKTSQESGRKPSAERSLAVSARVVQESDYGAIAKRVSDDAVSTLKRRLVIRRND